MPNKKQRQKLIEAGKCTTCGKNKDSEKTLCKSCLIYSKERAKIKRDERRDNGLCTYCGQNPPQPDRKICKDCHNQHSPKWTLKNQQYNLYNLLPKKHRKQRVMDHYGGKCLCCGETGLLFLTIDHVDENGAEHRKEISPNFKGKGRSGDLFYRWLEENNYPDGFQTLCFNCNIGKHWNNGVCPHQQTNFGV